MPYSSAYDIGNNVKITRYFQRMVQWFGREEVGILEVWVYQSVGLVSSTYIFLSENLYPHCLISDMAGREIDLQTL